MNDNRFAEAAPVDRRREHQRMRATLADLPSQIAANRELHRAAAVPAGRLDFDHQLLLSQLPFDEGRRHGVLGSSGEDALARAEPEAVRCDLCGYREGPRNASPAVAHQKEQVLFQFIEDDIDGTRSELQSTRNVVRLERGAAPDHLGHREVPDALVVRRHETQTSGHVLPYPTHFLAPRLGRRRLQYAASSKDHRLGHIYYDIVYYETVQI